jgi:hypothetical protein
MSPEVFWSKYKDLAAALVRPLGPEDRLPEAEIRAAEERLGVRLPHALRLYYQRAGRFAAINEAFNRLLPPAELRIEVERLVFYEEQQGAFAWGIRLDDGELEDPPVHQGAWDPPAKQWTWRLEQPQLTGFLLGMFYWQLANSEEYGVEERNTFAISEAALAEVRRQWPREPVDPDTAGFEVYRQGAQVLWVLREPGGLKLWMSAGSEQELTAVRRKLGLPAAD